MHKVVESAAALSDLIEIADYLTDNAGAVIAHQVIEAIRQSYSLLAMMPGVGALRPYNTPKLHALRMWAVPKFPNYLIFYDFNDQIVTIRRILHGARDIDALFQ